MGTRNVDPDVANARAVLARATQTGDVEQIVDARVRLMIANAERDARVTEERRQRALQVQREAHASRDAMLAEEMALHDAAAAFLADPQDRVAAAVFLGDGGPTKEKHQRLEVAQVAAARAFMADHGPSADWTAKVRDEYLALLRDARAAHIQFGCDKSAMCRVAQ